MEHARQLTLPRLAVAVLVSLHSCIGLTGCVNVATYTQPTLVRVIDASYVAPPFNVNVEGSIIAGNVGQGTISPYGTLPASTRAPSRSPTPPPATRSPPPAIPARRPSVLRLPQRQGRHPLRLHVTSSRSADLGPTGHSSFRFLNQAINTGPVDVYMVPNGSTLANSIPLVANLPVGDSIGYINFISQTVTMVIIPAGKGLPNTPHLPSTSSAAKSAPS